MAAVLAVQQFIRREVGVEGVQDVNTSTMFEVTAHYLDRQVARTFVELITKGQVLESLRMAYSEFSHLSEIAQTISGSISRLQTQFKVYLLEPVRQHFVEELKKLFHSGGDALLEVAGMAHQLGFDLVAEETVCWLKGLITSKCENPEKREIAQELQTWVEQEILPLADRLLPFDEKIQEVLQSQAYKKLGKSRVAQFFDLILDFPHTRSEILDLKTCLDAFPTLTKALIQTSKHQISTRILKPSKATAGILLMYINLTKVMKLLFPTIEVLEQISEPIKVELRRRTDTFRCIITSIAEDQELYQLLDIRQKSIYDHDEFSSDEDEQTAADWKPIPRSAVKSVISSLNKKSDIVSMLINIYGSQEQFMEDYRLFLSKKLIANTSFDVSKELTDLEMLKKRFGEGNVHKCEVMIKDVQGSKRINTAVHEKTFGSSVLSLADLQSLIVSSFFWPIEGAHFSLPRHLGSVFEAYQEQYSETKPSRKLKFHEQLGTVSLTLTFDNGQRTWDNMTPLHAAIISLFDGVDGEISAEQLASQLEIEPGVLKKEICVWESRGVIVRRKVGDKTLYHAVRTIK